MSLPPKAQANSSAERHRDSRRRIIHERPSIAVTLAGLMPSANICSRLGRTGSGLAASEDILLDDGVNAPVTVNHLGDTEVNADRDQRDCFIFRQLFGGHQE